MPLEALLRWEFAGCGALHSCPMWMEPDWRLGQSAGFLMVKAASLTTPSPPPSPNTKLLHKKLSLPKLLMKRGLMKQVLG